MTEVISQGAGQCPAARLKMGDPWLIRNPPGESAAQSPPPRQPRRQCPPPLRCSPTACGPVAVARFAASATPHPQCLQSSDSCLQSTSSRPVVDGKGKAGEGAEGDGAERSALD